MLKVYTRTGDKGETSLYGGERVKKDHQKLEAYGSVDELNSVVGIIVNKSKAYKVKGKKDIGNKRIYTDLLKIQKTLLLIGSLLSGWQSIGRWQLTKNIKNLENKIDKMDASLPKLNNFILPGGNEIATYCHLARTVCRRAERRVVGVNEKEFIQQDVLIYLNRLSDYFFVLARYFNFQENIKDDVWRIDIVEN